MPFSDAAALNVQPLGEQRTRAAANANDGTGAGCATFASRQPQFAHQVLYEDFPDSFQWASIDLERCDAGGQRAFCILNVESFARP